MNEMQLSRFTEVPPGGFSFKHPISGAHFSFHVYAYLVSAVEAHCASNNYPPISEEEIQQQMCERMGPDIAKRFCVGDGVSVAGVNLGWRDIWHGTKVLASFISGGRKTVDKEEAEARAVIRKPCSRNVNYVKPCGGDCPELEATVLAIVGGQTSVDSELGACSVCKCSIKAHVWVPIEHLKHGVTEEMMELFPPKCWKRDGIEALLAQNH